MTGYERRDKNDISHLHFDFAARGVILSDKKGKVTFIIEEPLILRYN